MIRSLARFIGTHSPAHLAWCSEVRSIPFKKTAKTSIGYLEKDEIDALLRQPDQRTALGARDHTLLLFLYNSGARADEAAKLTIGNLQLGRSSPSVRILGKGNKIRMCPLWPATTISLSLLVIGAWGAVAGVVGNEGGVISSLDQQAIPALERRRRSRHDKDYHDRFAAAVWNRDD